MSRSNSISSDEASSSSRNQPSTPSRRPNPEYSLMEQLKSAARQMQSLERMHSTSRLDVSSNNATGTGTGNGNGSNAVHLSQSLDLSVSLSRELETSMQDKDKHKDSEVQLTQDQDQDHSAVVLVADEDFQKQMDLDLERERERERKEIAEDFLEEGEEQDFQQVDVYGSEAQMDQAVTQEEQLAAEVDGQMNYDQEPPRSGFAEQLDKIRLIANFYDDKQKSILQYPDNSDEEDEIISVNPIQSIDGDHYENGSSVLNATQYQSPPRMPDTIRMSPARSHVHQSLQDVNLHDLYSDNEHQNHQDEDDNSTVDTVEQRNELLLKLLSGENDGRFGDAKAFHNNISVANNPLATERGSMVRSRSVDDRATTPDSRKRSNSRDGMTVNPMYDNTDNWDQSNPKKNDVSPQRLPATEVIRVDPPDNNRYSTPSRNNQQTRNSSPLSSISAINSTAEKPVKVVVRVRPFTDNEYDNRAKRTISKSGPDLIVVNPNAFDVEPDMIAKAAISVNDKQWAQPFRFDDCLWSYDPSVGRASYVDQLGVYEAIGSDLVDNAMNGVSCTCFAYGTIGTGKTYSLFGGSSRSTSTSNTRGQKSPGINRRRDNDDRITSESGLVPRVFADIVNAVKCSRVKIPNNRVFFSFIEIYNEKVVDLLSDCSDASTISSVNSHTDNNTTNNLKVREHPLYGPYVENLRKIEIFSVEEVLRLISKGQRNRSSTKTSINPESSRSHVICTLELASVDLNIALRPEKTVWSKREPMKKLGTPSHVPMKMDFDTSASAFNISNVSAMNGGPSVIKIQMVDLAGSDKLTESSAHASEKSPGRYGATSDPTVEKEKTELKMIRRSLNTLSQIVQSLGKGVSFRSLPYRDSVLTFLLRDALNGYNHTTMLATISPSHLSYDETIATLRYAEKLCLIRKKSLSQFAPPNQHLITNGGNYHQNQPDPSTDLVVQQTRPELDDEFRRFQQDLGSAKKGTLAARQLLQHTVSDPQQRIAKLTRNSTESAFPPSSHQNAMNNSRHTTPKKAGYSRTIPSDVTFTSPIDGSVRRLKELTGDDMEHLQSSYRNLQGQVIELQIDLDSLRTDRDSMVVELRGARDHINDLEQEKYDMNLRNQHMNKSLQATEKELNDLRGLIRRREEALERLMNELNEEKQARVNAEQAYHTRTNDFLNRFDNLKKENKMLQNSLEVARSRDGFSGVEKQQLLEQLSELQNNLTDQSRSLHSLQKENTQLREDLDGISMKATKFDEIAPKHQILQEEKVDLFGKLDKLRGDYEVLLTERNSLSSLVEQKDSLLWLQNQQSESNTKLLQNQIQQLQLQQQTMIKSEDWQRMQENIRHVFSNENDVLYHEITDTKKLTVMIKELHEKSKYFEKIQKKLEKENVLRKELEGKLIESVKLWKVEEKAHEECEDRIQLLERELMDAVKTKSYAIKHAAIKTHITNQIKVSSGATTQFTNLHNLSSLLPDEQADDATVAHLVQQLEQARSDNSYLLGQFEATQKENVQLKDDLAATQSSMQKEFSALWMSVQELNKLDALKDKSIQDLITERSQLTADRDTALERVKALSLELGKTKKDLQDVDQELDRVASSNIKNMSGSSHSVRSTTPERRKVVAQRFSGTSAGASLDESEKMLERQIEELSDFLQDEDRIKRTRSVRAPMETQRSTASISSAKQRRPTPSGVASTASRIR